MLDEAPCRKYNALKRTGYELAGGKSRNVPVGGGGNFPVSGHSKLSGWELSEEFSEGGGT